LTLVEGLRARRRCAPSSWTASWRRRACSTAPGWSPPSTRTRWSDVPTAWTWSPPRRWNPGG